MAEEKKNQTGPPATPAGQSATPAGESKPSDSTAEPTKPKDAKRGLLEELRAKEGELQAALKGKQITGLDVNSEEKQTARVLNMDKKAAKDAKQPPAIQQKGAPMASQPSKQSSIPPAKSSGGPAGTAPQTVAGETPVAGERAETPEDQQRAKDEAALAELFPPPSMKDQDKKDKDKGDKSGREKERERLASQKSAPLSSAAGPSAPSPDKKKMPAGKAGPAPAQLARQLDTARQAKMKSLKGRAGMKAISKLEEAGMGDGVFIIALFIAGFVDLISMKPINTALGTPSFGGSIFFFLYLIFYFISQIFFKNKFTDFLTKLLPFQGLEAFPIINMLPFWTLSVAIAWWHARKIRQAREEINQRLEAQEITEEEALAALEEEPGLGLAA